MTFLTPPTWLENSSLHNAQDYRVLLASLVGVGGIAAVGDLAVTEKSGTPTMSIDVAAGGVFVASTRADNQGTYHAYNDAVVNVAISAADATNPRIDRVLVQIRDEAQDAGLTQNDARIFVEEGTPAASPTAPTISVEDYIELAQVTVPASATSITDSNITDMRSLATLSVFDRSGISRFAAGRTTNQSISNNTWTTAVISAVEEDAGSDFNSGTYLFTAPVSGRYDFQGNVYFASSSSGARGVRFLINGAGNGVGPTIVGNGGASVGTGVNASANNIDLDAGDTVAMQAFQNSGGSLNIENASIPARFAGRLVGERV